MDLLIWGAGAIGGTIGAYLIRAGHKVTFVDRAAEHVAAINGSGLTITGPIDQFTVPAQAYVPEGLAGAFTHVLLCVKAQDTEQAACLIAPHLAPDGYIASMQNGLNELVIARVAGQERTVGAFINFGADYLEPGVILYGGRGAVVVGELDGSLSDRVRALQKTLLDFEPNAIVSANIWGYLWGKMAYGAQLFATALTNESIADCLADATYRPVYIALAQEILRVAAAIGVMPEPFNGFDPRAFVPSAATEVSLRSLDDMVAFNRRSAKTHSGIWRDLAVRKRRTEADAQLGPIVAYGQQHGVETPLTARLIALIHAIEDGELPQQGANLDELKVLL
ncbi:MAG: 2-dehydropantoate 2-reductase [Caldilineaceae bacterium]|nr:2-dehydropantoate 2-reductase [Caldilineaceae bacterium]